MTKLESVDLMYQVLRAMRWQESVEARCDLQTIGEGLLGEYKDLKFAETKIKIFKLSPEGK